MSNFDSNGNYNKTNWKTGDKITADKLNKIEDSLEVINNNDIVRHEETDERLDALEEQKEVIKERFDELEDLVADNKNEVSEELEGFSEQLANKASSENLSSLTLSSLGANLDGVTDDSDYIISSLNSRKEIFIEKIAKLSKDIQTINNKTIKGLDNAILVVNNNNCITLGDNCVLENLTIVPDKNYGATKPLIRICGKNVKVINCKFIIDKIQITTFINILQGSQNTTIDGCYFSGGATWDIHLSSQGNTVITNCYFDSHLDTETNRSNGIKVSHELISGDIDSSNADINLLAGENIVISNNYFGKHNDNAIDTFTGATNIIIVSNVFDESKEGAIENKTIYRNLPDPNSSSLDNGRNNKKMIISNNVFKGESKFDGYAITLTYSNETSSEHQIPYGFIITNNIFDNIQKGVNIGAVKDVIVSSNVFTNISVLAFNIFKTNLLKIGDNIINGELSLSAIQITDSGEFSELEIYNNTIKTSDKSNKKAISMSKSNSHVRVYDNVIENWATGILSRNPDSSKYEVFSICNNTFKDCDYCAQLGGQPNLILLKNNTCENSNALLHSSSTLKYDIVHSVGNTGINTLRMYQTNNIVELNENGNYIFSK